MLISGNSTNSIVQQRSNIGSCECSEKETPEQKDEYLQQLEKDDFIAKLKMLEIANSLRNND